ncbi:hypothetical protein EV424DRAFT_1320432 [Suillus variegatus]|nr:hypothetical protein EV424DRAFT_1320432 [Suillus variegatus]
MLVDLDVNIEHTPYTAPPGEEGGDLSHEGGEHEAFEGLAQKITDLSGFCHVDPCTHKDGIDIQNANWNMQMDRLIHAYLEYHTQDCGNGMACLSSKDELMCNDADNVSLENIELIDVFSKFFFSLYKIHIQ